MELHCVLMNVLYGVVFCLVEVVRWRFERMRSDERRMSSVVLVLLGSIVGF